MEPHNIYSHKMAINTHYIHERTIVLYSHSKEKIKKTKLKKKKISKKNLSATFYISSKCHFLSNGEGVSGHQAVNGHSCQLTSNYRKNKKKKSKKKNSKKKIRKKKIKKKKKKKKKKKGEVVIFQSSK